MSEVPHLTVWFVQVTQAAQWPYRVMHRIWRCGFSSYASSSVAYHVTHRIWRRGLFKWRKQLSGRIAWCIALEGVVWFKWRKQLSGLIAWCAASEETAVTESEDAELIYERCKQSKLRHLKKHTVKQLSYSNCSHVWIHGVQNGWNPINPLINIAAPLCKELEEPHRYQTNVTLPKWFLSFSLGGKWSTQGCSVLGSAKRSGLQTFTHFNEYEKCGSEFGQSPMNF
jgi:hypothetical protein